MKPFFYFDEMADITQKDFDELMGRLSNASSNLTFISTPPTPPHWLMNKGLVTVEEMRQMRNSIPTRIVDVRKAIKLNPTILKQL